MSIQNMRKNYLRAGLRKTDVDADPMVQFQSWFDEADQPDLPDWFEINAMTLSTTDKQGQVTSRIVLLKGIEDGRLFFYTNYDSVKGQQIAQNPSVSLCFFWPHLQRQVRIEGTAHRTDRKRSREYFATRPRESQIGAHVSRQSAEVANREVLEQRRQELEKQYEGGDVPCPENWGGYEVQPVRFEFWQGRAGRLHDRICYQRQPDRWLIQRRSP